MNSKLLIIVIVVIVLIGGGVFLASKKTSQPQATQTKTMAPTSAPTVSETQGTLKDLLSSTTSQTCTFSSNESDVAVSGTVYATSGKVREDYTSSGGSVNITGHVIVMDQTMYTWTDGTKQGMKMVLPTGTQASPTGSMANNKTPNINSKMNFSCKPWGVDSSKFTLPTDVTFSAFTVPGVPSGAMMPHTTGSTGKGSNSSACSACDSIPAGASRDACKAQLHC